MIRAAVSTSPGASAKEIPWSEAKGLIGKKVGTLWVDALNASSEEIAELEHAFMLHPLTVEDLLHRNQRAKVEEYPGYLFVVMQWFSAPQPKQPCELHCVLGDGYLLTLTDAADEALAINVPVSSAWARFLVGSPRGPFGADGVLYRVLDALVDEHIPRVDELEEAIEQVNEQVIEQRDEGSIVQEIVRLRRHLVTVRRVLSPERDVLSALSRRTYDLIDDKTAMFFRDVHDHLNRTYEMIESLRELDEMVMDVQLAMVESRRSAVIKRLTIVSTIFLPMSFLASFFGMNFTKIPFDSVELMYGAYSAMVLIPAALMVWLLAKRWL